MARDHCPHALCETGKTYHGEVNQKEENQEIRDEEMDGARGLLATEHINEARKNRSDSGRHGKASPDHGRKQNENHCQVRDPLEGVIRQRLCFRWPLQVQMIRNQP
jgi:hypothetical protein